jgi:hypothetical protein
MPPEATLEDVLNLAQQLSPLDKVRLVERVSAQLEKDLTKPQRPHRKSLRGLWQGVDVTEQDMAEARQAMWKNFR